MTDFVDRQRELAALHDRFARRSSFALVYGQRRVGKTFMLQHAVAGLPDAIYFVADESTSSSLLRRFHAAVARAGRGGPAWTAIPPTDWGALLTLLAQQTAVDDRPVTLVLDECQYLLAAEPALASILQRIWDEFGVRGRLHLVLCGSALGTLAALGEVGQPLHGRFDLRLKVQAFGYREAALFAPGWARAERFRLYGVFGGLARHLAEVRRDEALAASAVRSIVDPLGALHEAPLDLLRAERLSGQAEANALLAAVAHGENQFNALAARAGLTASRTDYVLKELLELEVLRKEVRYGDRPGSRYARYRCTDPFTAFWFRLIRPNRGALIGATPAGVWADRIAPRLDDHMGRIFEQIVWQALTRSPLVHDPLGPVDEVAPYWSRDGQHEVDLVARCGDTSLFVECKWRPNGEVDLPDLQQLRSHVAAFPQKRLPGPTRLALATAGGFTDRLRQVAEAEGVLLFGPGELLPE